MGWFNYYGLIIMAVIMVPNIIYAVKRKDETGSYKNKAVEVSEQIGRYGCFIFMIFNIPYAYFNFWFEHALIVYLAVNDGLCLLYLIFWALYGKLSAKFRALILSVIPSCIFIFSGIILANIPLVIFAVLFAATHIFISYKSALTAR